MAKRPKPDGPIELPRSKAAAAASASAADGGDDESSDDDDRHTRRRRRDGDGAGKASHNKKKSGGGAGAGPFRAIAVEQFHLKTGQTIDTFESQHAAGRALGIFPTNISGILCGKPGHKTAKGFGFRKADKPGPADGNHPILPLLTLKLALTVNSNLTYADLPPVELPREVKPSIQIGHCWWSWFWWWWHVLER